MTGELLVERLVDFGRLLLIVVARQPVRIGFRDAQHGIVELVGALETRAGVLFLARQLQDHAGMQVLEDRIPVRTGQLVDAGHRALGVAGAIGSPSRQQCRDEIGDGATHGLIDVELGRGIFLLFERLHADHKPRNAVRLVGGEDLLSQLDRLIDVALGDGGDEGAVQKLVVLRIGAQRGAIELGGGSRIALDAGMAGGQIAARHRQRLQVVAGRKLRCGRRRGVGMFGRLRQNRARQRHRGESEGSSSPAIATNGKHHGFALVFEEV